MATGALGRNTPSNTEGRRHRQTGYLTPDPAPDFTEPGEKCGLAAHAEAFCRRVREGLAAADFERKRALLELLVDRVIVTDGAVEIRYVVPTGPEGEQAPFSRLRTDYRGRHLAMEARHR